MRRPEFGSFLIWILAVTVVLLGANNHKLSFWGIIAATEPRVALFIPYAMPVADNIPIEQRLSGRPETIILSKVQYSIFHFPCHFCEIVGARCQQSIEKG